MAEEQDGKGKFSISGALSSVYNETQQAFARTRPGRALTSVFNSRPISAVRRSFNAVAGVYKSTPVRAVRAYVWPFRIGKALWAQRLIIPVLLAHQMIQTPTVYLFPKAEDFLKDQGISASVAKELSDRDIRVRQRNFLGRLHSYNDLPTLIGMYEGYNTLLEPAQAYAHPDLATRLLGQCPVTLSDPDLTARDAVAALANLSEDEAAQIENIPVSDKEIRTAIAFHEFRHCDTKNTAVDPNSYPDALLASAAIPNHAESDADAHGYEVASRVFHDPGINKTMLYARALNTHVGAHDTALYLDAYIRKQPLPRELDAMQATKDVFSQLEIYQRNNAGKLDPDEPSLNGQDQDPMDALDKLFALVAKNQKVEDAIALQQLVAIHPDMFSDLAKQRAQLFVDAVKYFYPAQLAEQSVSAKFSAVPARPLTLHFVY